MPLDFTSSNNATMVGWNQSVKINDTVVRVRDFSVGITQRFEVPDLVGGRTDRITWSKGVIEVGGSINAPLTVSLADTIIKAAESAAFGSAAESGNGVEPVLEVWSDVHGTMQCMVNTVRISVDEGGPIDVSCDLFGRLAEQHLSGTASTAAASTAIGGTILGSTFVASEPEQIPMFDQVSVGESFIPGGSASILPIGCTFTIDNKLQRNYVLGVSNGTQSKWGSLDAYSISAGQRVMAGTMRFQSGLNKHMTYIENTGITVTTTGEDILNFADLIVISGDNFFPIWSAAPPQLNSGKVTVELEFQFLAKNGGLWRFTS